MPCNLVRHFHALHFHILHFQRPRGSEFRAARLAGVRGVLTELGRQSDVAS